MSSRIEDVLPQLRTLFLSVRDSKASHATDRSPSSQVLNALVRLMATILSYVHLTEDVGDELVYMLAPFLYGSLGGEVRRALSIYNDDALWLLEYRENKAGVANG
jgi:hypothetical protein